MFSIVSGSPWGELSASLKTLKEELGCQEGPVLLCTESNCFVVSDDGPRTIGSIQDTELVQVTVVGKPCEYEYAVKCAELLEATGNYADALFFQENQESIPEEYRGYKLIFPQAELRDGSDRKSTVLLIWNSSDHKWELWRLWTGMLEVDSTYRALRAS